MKSLVLLLIHLLGGVPKAPAATVDDAIAWCAEALQIHEYYIQIEQNPEMGDDEWHRHWVQRYAAIIKLLESLKGR